MKGNGTMKSKGKIPKGEVKTDQEDMMKLLESRRKARLVEQMRTARELLKGDKDGLKRLGKHKLIAFYDNRFKDENGGKGRVMLVFGDTLGMDFESTVIAASYANVMEKSAKYAVDTGMGTLFRLDGKPVTIEDGRLMAKGYDEYLKGTRKARK